MKDAAFVARQDEYLESATQTFSPGSPLAVIAAAERAARDRSFTFDAAAVTPEALAPIFARMDGFVDTADFDVLYLLNLWYGYRRAASADDA